MFVGHYGPSFAAKRIEASIPLWVLFLAAQFLDVLWAPFVLLGIEKVRIVSHFTGSNALDLYYMPYTHGLPGALGWSLLAALLYQLIARPARARAAWLVGIVVFSHWMLDLIVHVPDLPLYGNAAKVGFGLWNARVLAFGLEALVLIAGIWLFLTGRPRHRVRMVIFGIALVTVQIGSTFLSGPPPSDRAVAVSALTAYAAFALLAWWAVDRGPAEAGAA